MRSQRSGRSNWRGEMLTDKHVEFEARVEPGFHALGGAAQHPFADLAR